MNQIMMIHIAGGMAALAAGATAVAARNGSALHASSGTWFVVSMLTLGVTAAILEPMRTPVPGSPIGGIMICYFVLTGWATAQRRDGVTGWREIAAGVVALGMAALMIWGAFNGGTTPGGTGPVFVLGGILLLAGFLDLSAALREQLQQAQRIARHVWRMCFAFFIATGSFFLGQQDVLPAIARGSPLLFLLAFAPFGVMAFWLLRLRFPKAVGRIHLRVRQADAAA